MIVKTLKQNREETAKALTELLLREMKMLEENFSNRIEQILELNPYQDIFEVQTILETNIERIIDVIDQQKNLKAMSQQEDESHYPGPVKETVKLGIRTWDKMEAVA